MMEQLVGQPPGRYQISELLGQGGMGAASTAFRMSSKC